MPLKLMYITNRPDIALIAEKNGVDRIFLDMDWIGKAARQGGMDSVQNRHTIGDVRAVRAVLQKAELLVRVNPIHDALPTYPSSEEEIDAAIEAGADILMLPYYKTAEEVRRFVNCVGGRAKTMLLLETKEAADHLETILAQPGIDEVHIGLNDLSLAYGLPFMFQLLTNGTVESLCMRLKQIGVPYGFGGIASLGRGLVPAEMIIKEHYRLGSDGAILSRSFCNVDKITDRNAIEEVFLRGIREIRMLERECEYHTQFFRTNEQQLKKAVQAVADGIQKEKAK